MGKPRQLTRLGHQHVLSVMATAPSISAAARALHVNQSTASRWVKAGRVPRPGTRRLAAAPLAAPESHQEADGAPLAPAAWAAALRQRFVFSIGEVPLLQLAELAFAMALDEDRDDATRLSASKQCASLLRQLGIPEDDHGETQDSAILPGA